MIKKHIFFVILIGVLGLYLRFYHIEFGLPHSFHADEPEIVELAIKYTYEIRSIISNNEYYKLIPISYVYGTFPAYFFTGVNMFFSKILNIFNFSFDKTTLYIILRSVNLILTFTIIPAIVWLSYKLFKNKKAWITAFILLALNWKLIVHAHYINTDIIVALLLTLSFLTFLDYHNSKNDTKYTVLTGILFGLAVGTKITALITLPAYIYVFLVKKDYRNIFGFLFTIFAVFMATNPFSIIFANDFAFRIYTMLFKEAGMTFDSVNYNPFKYIGALSWIATLPVFIMSLYGKYYVLKHKRNPFHIFLISNVFIYLIFYSVQSRRVDRWVLPILPVVILYASYAWAVLSSKIIKPLKLGLEAMILGYYLFFPLLLLFQFQRYTPKAQAYLWAQNNLPVYITNNDYTLVYTEEGLDPLNKLQGTKVIKYEVYGSENAQFFMPEDPMNYEYVILSSRPMENFKKPEIRKAFPFYAQKWDSFEYTVNSNFKLIKTFSLPKPNLIPLSNVYIYEKKEL